MKDNGTLLVTPTPKMTDFDITGLQEGHPLTKEDVAALTMKFEKSDHGNSNINVSITLNKAAQKYYVSPIEFSIRGHISQKEVIVTPKANQKKTFGKKDPSNLGSNYTTKGLIEGHYTETGSLVRDKGEDVGRYRIRRGTLSFGDNYKVTVKAVYFTIRPKAVNLTNLFAGTGSICAVWDPLSAKDINQIWCFEIEYSTDSSFKGSEVERVWDKKTSFKALYNLKSETEYFVRIRAFKNQYCYSVWSDPKSIKTK